MCKEPYAKAKHQFPVLETAQHDTSQQTHPAILRTQGHTMAMNTSDSTKTVVGPTLLRQKYSDAIGVFLPNLETRSVIAVEL